MIHSKSMGIGVITGLCSMAALAEPAVQPGDTLESLSKVKVTTTPGKDGHPFDLYSFGADGKEGGEGNDADIYYQP